MRNELLIYLTLAAAPTQPGEPLEIAGMSLKAIIEETDQAVIKIHIQSGELRRRHKPRRVSMPRRRSLKRSRAGNPSLSADRVEMTCYILARRDGQVMRLQKASGTISREPVSSG